MGGREAAAPLVTGSGGAGGGAPHVRGQGQGCAWGEVIMALTSHHEDKGLVSPLEGALP